MKTTDALAELLTVLERRSASWTPTALASVVQEMRAKSKTTAAPVIGEDRFTRAVEAFLSTPPRSLRATHLRTLAFTMGVPHPLLGGKAVADHDRFGDLLAALSATFQPTYWLGTFKAYLTLPTGASSAPLLRMWLKSTAPRMAALTRPPGWWPPVSLHLGLLEPSPEAAYVAEYWLGRRDRIDHLVGIVDLPVTSWLWSAIARGACQRTMQLRDDEALADRIARLLELGDELDFVAGQSLVGDELLAESLERWSRLAGQPRNDLLLQRSVGAWGNPQLALAGEKHHWSRVRDEVVTMVCGWVAEEDLRDFHELTKRNSDVEDERLAYWLRFKRQISFTQLVIGDDIASSRDPDVVDFRNRKGVRLARLQETTNSNNAIIIRLGDLWVVEFSEKGNAAYPYHSKALPLQPGAPRFRLSQLKNKRWTWPTADTRLSHFSDWQARFDGYLAQQGIWPDGMGRRPASASIAPTIVRQRADNDTFGRSHRDPERPRTSPEAKPEASPFILQGLPEPLARRLVASGARLDDLRSKGGALWIRFDRAPPSSIALQLRAFGFRAMHQRDAFWKN